MDIYQHEIGAQNISRQRLTALDPKREFPFRVIDALTADGRPVADALRVAGVLPAEYEEWRNEYAGLLCTLDSLASAPPKVMRKLRRAGPGRPVRTIK